MEEVEISNNVMTNPGKVNGALSTGFMYYDLITIGEIRILNNEFVSDVPGAVLYNNPLVNTSGKKTNKIEIVGNKANHPFSTNGVGLTEFLILKNNKGLGENLTTRLYLDRDDENPHVYFKETLPVSNLYKKGDIIF